jgi:O-antigen/teichoic acid export membrane protein
LPYGPEGAAHNRVASPIPKPKSLFSSAAWNITGLLTLGLISFITVPIVIGVIGTSDYGVYLLVATIGGFAGLLDLGLGEATSRYVAQYYARGDIAGINRVVGATFAVYLFTGVIGGSIILACAPGIVGLLRLDPQQLGLATRLVRWSGLAFVLWVMAGAVRSVPEATQRYDVGNKLRIVMAIVQGLAMVLAVKLGYGVTGLVVWMVANSALNIVVAVVVAKKLIPGLRPWPVPSRAGLREVFGYGVFSFVNQTIGTLSIHADRLILGAFFGPAQVSILEVPKTLLLRGVGIYVAAGAALFPRFSSMKEGPGMRSLFLNSTWSILCFSLVLFVPTTIVLPEFLRLWLGQKFADQSAAVAQIIAAVLAIEGLAVPYYSLLRGTDRVHWLTVIYVVGSGISIVAAVVLVPMFGVMGGGYRLLVTAWFGTTIMLVVCRKVFPEVRLGSFILTCLAAPMAIGLVCGSAFWAIWTILALHGWVWVILAWVVMASILAVCLWATNRVLTGAEGAAAQLLASTRAHLWRRKGLIPNPSRR